MLGLCVTESRFHPQLEKESRVRRFFNFPFFNHMSFQESKTLRQKKIETKLELSFFLSITFFLISVRRTHRNKTKKTTRKHTHQCSRTEATSECHLIYEYDIARIQILSSSRCSIFIVHRPGILSDVRRVTHNGKLVDNFSPESDVTSLQDPFTSRPYKTPF